MTDRPSEPADTGEHDADGLARLSTDQTAEQFRALLDQLPLMATLIAPDGTASFSNSYMRRYFRQSHLPIGDDLGPVHPDDGAQIAEALRRAIETRSGFHVTGRHLTGGDEYRWLETWGSPCFDTAGTYVGHVAVSVDVHDLRSSVDAERSIRRSGEIFQHVAMGLARAATAEEVGAVLATGLRDGGLGEAVVRVRHHGDLVVADTSTALHDGGGGDTPSPLSLVDPGPVAEAFRTGRTSFFSSRDQLVADRATLREPEFRTAGAALIAPIAAGTGGVIGVLSLVSDTGRHFGRDELDLVDALCAQAAAAFERAAANGRLVENRTQADLAARLLAEIQQLSTEGEQLSRAVELLVPTLGDVVIVEAPDAEDRLLAVACLDDHDQVVNAARRHSTLEHSLESSMIRPGSEPVLIVDPLVDVAGPGPATASLLRELRARSAMAFPLSSAGIGECTVIVAITRPNRRRYDRDDLAAGLGIVERIGGVLADTAARSRSQRTSTQLQRALLPPRLAPHDHIDIAAVYQTDDDQLGIGGDWYDTYVWPDGKYAIIVGDVVGHGSDAAVAMGRIRSAASATIPDGPPDPDAILASIERFALQTGAATFVTAGCVVIDPVNDTLTYSLAGHPPPLLARRSETSRWLDQSLGGPICPLIAERPPATVVDLRPDDLVVLYTDGLIDRRTMDLGDALDQLADFTDRLGDAGVDLINRRILDRLAAGGDDDVVVVSAKYKSTAARFRTTMKPDPNALEGVRHELRHWLIDHAVESSLADDIVLATNEATVNSITHAGLVDRESGVKITAALTSEGVEVTVRDDGIWAEAAPDRFENRRRGTDLMQQLATHFVRGTSASGTTVVMLFEHHRP